MAAPGGFKCNMCPMSFSVQNKHIIHVLRDHKDENRFSVSCSVKGCKYSTRSWPCFRKHCSRAHLIKLSDMFARQELKVGDVDEDFESTNMSDDDNNPDLADLVFLPRKKVDSSSLLSKFLLTLETKHHLTRKGLNSVTGCIDEIFDIISSQVKQSLHQNLDLDRDDPVVAEVSEICKSDIGSLLTERARHKVYEKSFQFLPPKPIFRHLESKQLGYHVPLAQALTMLLQQEQIWKLVCRKPRHSRKIMTDFADGQYLQSHDLMTKDTFLQLVLYYDDLELQNPLRSNKKHKLGMFYFTILNLPVNLRSQLQNIFALAVARVSNIKAAGFSVILADFLDTVKQLRTKGLVISRGEETHNFYGDLVAVMCDTPAAAAIGGFKGSSAFSTHFCRNCLATQNSFKEVTTPDVFQERDMETYLRQCETLENKAIQKRRQFWSKLYGINERSCLCVIPDFPVTKCLLQDPMHVLLEGCLPYVLALFLAEKIYNERTFKLGELNDFICMQSNFRQDRKDVAVPIEPKQIRNDHHVKQKASTMLVMAYNLPIFLAGYFFEDAQYNNLLSLIRVTVQCFRPKCDATSAGVLQQEITNFLESFKHCYPGAKVKPKMHFLLHLPQQLIEFGPLRNHSTMRAEGKHQSFKDHRWRNFNNLPNSLLKRHQLGLANQLTDGAGNFVSNFLQETNEGRGSVVQVSGLNAETITMMNDSLVLQEGVEHVKENMSLMWRGREYNKGECVLLAECEVNGPTFGILEKMYTIDDKMLDVFAVTTTMKTEYFDPGFNAYRVVEEGNLKCAKLSKLVTNWSVPLHVVRDKLYIVNRYGIMP